MKVQLWIPKERDGKVPYVYTAGRDGETYYYVYSPKGAYYFMDPKEWHGPYRFDEGADFTDGHEKLTLCRGTALKRLRSLGFTFDDFPGGAL